MSYQERSQELPDLPKAMSPESSRRLIRKPGRVLRDMREVCGFSTSAIATGTGIPVDRWIAYESDERSPTVAELERIATFFDADVRELLAVFRQL